MGKDVVFSHRSIEWATPQYLFDELNEEFHFTLDPCATEHNAKCAKFYTKEQDGLLQDWTGETVFCNPPYGKEVKPWVIKCLNHAYRGGWNCCYVNTGKDRYQSVPRLYLSSCRDSFYQRQIDVWREQERCTVPFNGCSL